MKRLLTALMTIALLLPGILPANADAVEVKPFYGIGSSDFNRIKFPNLEGKQRFVISVKDDAISLFSESAGSDKDKMAASLKQTFDRLPHELRQLTLFRTSKVCEFQENAIFFDKGFDMLKEQFSAFLKAYVAIDGKLDSVFLDHEYVKANNWYIYTQYYRKDAPTIYWDIVKDPRYATEVRPMLVERGFVFYEDSSGYQSELWSIYPNLKGAEKEKYAISREIWDKVMRIRLNNYLTEAVYAPLQQYMPHVTVSDYQSRATYAWLKDLSDSGEHKYISGNSVPVGDISHHNTYGSRLSSDFFVKDGMRIYKNPVAYNKAVYEITPFNRFLWDINLMKNMYEASGGKVCLQVSEYDDGIGKEGTTANTPYYTETVLHFGLMDPQEFKIYMYDKDFEAAEYDKRAQVLQEILEELTRVAGFADRKPIHIPAVWNWEFVLSGIYANGRNLWRLTPDTCEGVSLEACKVPGEDPTFSIGGQTITFPQGKIIPDGEISVVGTCGYWIETPKNVTPVITADTNRYGKYPSFEENFEDYAAGAAFDSANAKPVSCWNVAGTAPAVESYNGSQVLAMTGSAVVSNVKLPQNITAGDYYAKQQVWEVSVILSEPLSGDVVLLTCEDGGFRLSAGKVQYDRAGAYVDFPGLSLTSGQEYTLRREVNFCVADAYTSTYSVLDAAGKVIAEAENVPMKRVSLPVTAIGLSCTNVTGKVYLDDYKLYPTGITTDFEVYNAATGIMQKDNAQAAEHNVAYRLSWLNGSDTAEKREVVAFFYDASGKLVSQKVVKQIEMKPGCDNVDTGIVEVESGQFVVLSLQNAAEPTLPSVTLPTTVPTTAPTKPVASMPLVSTAPINPVQTHSGKAVWWCVGAVLLVCVGTGAIYWRKKRKQ